MEDEDLSSSNPRETLTTTTKHDAMLERLANRHQTRLKNSATRRDAESDSSDSPSFESTDSFLSRFTELSRAAECRISRCRIAQPDIVKAELAGIADSISDLEKLVAENSYFLPSYEVRSSLRAVSDLRQSLEVLSSKLLPKKKFSFKSKASKKETSQRIKESEAPEAERINFSVPESPGFRGKTGELLVKKFDGSEIGEFTISDLDSCEVRLIGCVRALFVHRLRNCRIYGGPVTASILIEGAENCIFVVASHQIRIHHAKGTDFYLRVRSRPIIEDSEKVRFAPYHLSYEGLEEDLKNAGLEEETGNWANVDDFRWLRAVQSPNWSVLPESERLGLIKISDSVLNRDEKI